ncbi:alcohol dehydrogenase, class IV [Bifidobacterium margollesii]|uniref:Alcohol dehydrogenase, class IV n=2 Tax=Bifidobacterium margollesii TaxID=2020964 RepID=A0A2N5J8K5_9BIFI|nr:alcohol dehydrogenase, class IV [Bifidobacterium margollesii]
MPWSFRLPGWARMLVGLVSGAIVGFVGSCAYRMGVPQNIPYGLVLALLLVGISAWSARARSGSVGLGLHLVSSGMVTWLLTETATTSRAMIIFGYTSDAYSFVMQKSGIIWLLGMVAVQVVLVMLPDRMFVVPPRSSDDDRRGDESHTVRGVGGSAR